MKNTYSNIDTKVRAHKQTKWEAKQNRSDRKNNRNVAVRDIVSHRTYSFRPSEVNITKTRVARPGNLIIHDWATDTIQRLPCKKPILIVSEKSWKKFARGHRGEW